MVERVFEVNLTAKWSVFFESGTYSIWNSLFWLLDQLDLSIPLYMGSPISIPRKAYRGEYDSTDGLRTEVLAKYYLSPKYSNVLYNIRIKRYELPVWLAYCS